MPMLPNDPRHVRVEFLITYMGHKQSISDKYSENDAQAILIEYKKIEKYFSVEVAIAGTQGTIRNSQLEKLEKDNKELNTKLDDLQETVSNLVMFLRY